MNQVLRLLVMVNVYMYISYEWLLPYVSRERLHNKWLTMGKTLRMIAVHSYSCKQASRIYDLNTTLFCHLSTLVITRFFRHDSLIALAPLTIGTIRKPECWWSGGAGHGKNIVGGFLRRAARIHCRAMKWFTQRFWVPIIGVLSLAHQGMLCWYFFSCYSSKQPGTKLGFDSMMGSHGGIPFGSTREVPEFQPVVFVEKWYLFVWSETLISNNPGFGNVDLVMLQIFVYYNYKLIGMFTDNAHQWHLGERWV